jgi:hypothetical protein
MNATLGVELPFTNFMTQTTVPYGYVDPPTEIFKDGETQIWKITHNGVDTHAIHFHLFNVQVVNRVGWDGAIRPPEPNELSWKDTVRMNPLEDVIVALRPLKMSVPFQVPNSIRRLDVTMPPDMISTTMFTNIDPTNQPATSQLTASAGSVTLRWVDNAYNETGFTLQRATTANGPWTAVATLPASAGTGGTVSYVDRQVTARTTYYYRAMSNNEVGYTQSFAAPAIGYPQASADSAPTATASVTPWLETHLK